MKINICGDFTTNGYGGIAVKNKTALDAGIVTLFKNSDYNIVNLEAPMVETGMNKIKKQGPHLSTTYETISYLHECGVQMLTLANNHFCDYGKESVKLTIDSISGQGMDYVGGGSNTDMLRTPLIKTIEGVRFAVLNYCENEFSTISDFGSNPLDIINVHRDIKDVKEKSDYVIVIVHGGHEGYNLPTPRMKKTYRFFIDAGANLVVNHHQHCHTGWEDYHGGRIYYGLGNFFFDYGDGKERPLNIWHKGFILSVVLDESLHAKFEEHPYYQCYIEKKVRLLDEKERTDFFEGIDKLNEIICSDELLKSHFDQFCMNEAMNIRTTLSPYSGRIANALCRRHLLPSFLSEKRQLEMLNKFRCEAHRDLFENGLKIMQYGYSQEV